MNQFKNTYISFLFYPIIFIELSAPLQMDYSNNQFAAAIGILKRVAEKHDFALLKSTVDELAY
jgi:hypothetical protein